MKKILLFVLAYILLSGCSGILGETEYYLYNSSLSGDYFTVYEYNSRGEVVCDHYVCLDEEGKSETIVADKSTTSVEVPKKSTVWNYSRVIIGTGGKIALDKGETTLVPLDIDY